MQTEPLHICKPYAGWLEAAIWAIAYDDPKKLHRAIMKDERNRDGELELDREKLEAKIHHVGMYGHVLIQKFFGGDPFWAKEVEQEDGMTVHTYGRRGFRMADSPLENHEIGDTALHLSAKNNKPNCMRLLLKLGARQNVFNKVGRTAKACAPKGSVCSSIFAEVAKQKRELKRQKELEESGMHHVPSVDVSQELLAAEEHAFESLELDAQIQVDYTDNPDKKAAEHVYYYLRKRDIKLPEKASIAIAFGSEDHRVAERCYQLYKDGCCDRFLVTGGVALDPERQMPIANRLKIHLVSKGVPAEKVLTETGPTDLLASVQCAVLRLEALGDFHCPRFDAYIVAAPYQQRRAWQTCLQQFPDWVWLHNAALQSTIVDHGATVDNSWEVDEEYYRKHLGKSVRTLCVEEMEVLFEYEELGYCEKEDNALHQDVEKAFAVLKARAKILDHFEERASMAKKKMLFLSA